jgi:hypothetical protein
MTRPHRHAEVLRFGGFVAKLAMDVVAQRRLVHREIVRNSEDTTWVTAAIIREYIVGQPPTSSASSTLSNRSRGRTVVAAVARLHQAAGR